MYYSVFKGFNKGIYRSWKECEREVKDIKVLYIKNLN